MAGLVLTGFETALSTLVVLGTSIVILLHFLKEQTSSTPKSESQTVPHPVPLLDFDLTTARTRNHLYANKTVRYPYYQVRLAGCHEFLRLGTTKQCYALRLWLINR